jgi:hypothetical protein
MDHSEGRLMVTETTETETETRFEKVVEMMT